MSFRLHLFRKNRPILSIFALASSLSIAWGQADLVDEEVIELSPFSVTADDDEGYQATHTLAGTRIRTELRDIGSAISVITKEFLLDTGSVDNTSLLVYTIGTEVGGTTGNFSGAGNGQLLFESFQSPGSNTRVRGLTAADNTVDFHLTNIPWDSFNVDRIDVQRGPNAILFGFGSPAGIINASRIQPKQKDQGELGLRFDGEGSLRASLDINKVLIKNQLAFRIAALNDQTNYRQKPAFEDDRRIFITSKYEPSFLKGDKMRTTFQVSYENGDISANRPRSIPPMDQITPWFNPVRLPDGSFNPAGGMGQGLFSPVQININNPLPGQTNVGQLNANYGNGSVNPDYIPALGGFPQSFGGLHVQFEGADGTYGQAWQTEPHQVTARGIGPTGAIDGGIGGLPYQRPGAIDRFPEIARKLGLPYEELGQYKNVQLSDRSIFDFWNILIDGPNKSETQQWNQLSASLNQTFFNNRLGYEVSFDKQDYLQEREMVFSGGRYAINVDTNSTYSDGSPNPDAGRPFISDTGQFGQASEKIDRESLRLTAFAEHDFASHDTSRSWWRRLLGRHQLTGLISQEDSSVTSQNWHAYGTDEAYASEIGVTNFVENTRQFNPVIYLGPSLLGRSSAAGANIPGVASPIVLPTTISSRIFDSTWNATTVNPAAPFDSNGDGTLNSTQSENPANYVGWVNRDVRVLQAKNGDRDLLTRALDTSSETIESEVLVLQSFFWDGAVVGTYGWRHDVDEVYSVRATQDPDTARVDFSSLVLPDDPVSILDTESNSWSVAVHLNELFGLADRLPVDVSVYYNESENFQPAAGRIDIYGSPLAAPSGKTVDKSILIATKDRKFSLKVTEFETSVTNGSADTTTNAWFVGQIMNRGDTAANRFEFDVNGGRLGVPNNSNTYGRRSGQSAEEAAAEEAAAIAGWRALQQAVFDLSTDLTGDPHAFYTAWGSDPNVTPPQSVAVLRTPNGFALTQDATSKGYEFEFTAQPNSNWRIQFNAAQVEAIRENIGGEAFLKHVTLMEEYLNNTPAGNLRVFGGGAAAETTLGQWNRVFGGNWQLTKLQEGSASPELREWRFNLVTNYRFNEGRLKGWNVGAGYRWQDNVVIGYPLVASGTGGSNFDLANPYIGPTEGDVDLWVGYQRKLTDKITWRAQLNVRNVFAKNELIPISAQPDGTPGGLRLGSATSWTFSNTFSF